MYMRAYVPACVRACMHASHIALTVGVSKIKPRPLHLPSYILPQTGAAVLLKKQKQHRIDIGNNMKCI